MMGVAKTPAGRRRFLPNKKIYMVYNILNMYVYIYSIYLYMATLGIYIYYQVIHFQSRGCFLPEEVGFFPSPTFERVISGWKAVKFTVTFFPPKKKIPRHPVIPPEVWCFRYILDYFGGANTSSQGVWKPREKNYLENIGTYHFFRPRLGWF